MNPAVAEKPVATVALSQRVSLVQKFASKYSLEPEKLLTTLKATAFKVKQGEVTNEQMAALLVVADQYGLNPFTREIFAFPDKQGIVPVVGVDGWSRIINEHPQSDGFEFRQAEEMMQLQHAQKCPEWMEVVIYRKDRSHPIVVREYIDEVYRPPFVRDDGSIVKGPWQTHTKRFLRHKVLIQGARIAYGFTGIFDEDEAERIVEGHVISSETVASGTARLKAALGAGTNGVQAPAAAPATDGTDEGAPPESAMTAIDHIAKLDECSSVDEIGAYSEKLPEHVRNDERFTRAVARRLGEIKERKRA